jgi:hypothetical protein
MQQFLFVTKLFNLFFFNGTAAPSGPGPPHYRCFAISTTTFEMLTLIYSIYKD